MKIQDIIFLIQDYVVLESCTNRNLRKAEVINLTPEELNLDIVRLDAIVCGDTPLLHIVTE